MKPYASHALLALLILSLAAPAWGLPPKEEWIELRSPSFTLSSNATERKAQALAADLERLRDVLQQLSPGIALSSPVPSYLFVFKGPDSFLPYQKTYNGQPLKSDGYFLARPFANFVAVNGDAQGHEREVLYHEYIHYVMRNNFATLPLWLHEGLAEYYSTFDAGKAEARIGVAVPEHVRWLRDHPLIPLATLFAVKEDSPEYNEASRRGAFYSESWVLVHYLISGNAERRQQALEFLRLAQAGTPPEQLFQKAFGADPAVLERELRSYIKSYIFASSRVAVRPQAAVAIEERPLAWPDVLSRLGDLLANLGDEHRAAAEEHFQAALQAQPEHASALAGLGFLRESADRPAEARLFYERAARLAPEDFRIQYLYARSLLEDPGDDSLRQARSALARVVKIRPDFGEAWASLGYSYQSEETLDAGAVQALETAHRLLPSRLDVAHNLAMAYVRTGRPAQAQELIDRVLVPGKAEPELIDNVREALLDEEQNRAESLLEEQKLEEAVAMLESLRGKTSHADRRDALAARIEEIRLAQDFNRFVELYNQAVELVNRGNVRGAVAILEPLAKSARNPGQAEQARTLLQRLQPPRKRK
ncbi:MAG: tetratricopeptide repeat protein [Thermoanaerobaculia bacterium]